MVKNMCLTCRSRGTPFTAAAMLVVSESGDILSPKKEPQIMLAAVRPGVKPRPAPMPIRATPTVPMVPQEVPVASEVREQTIRLVTRKRLGVMMFRPT